MKRVKCYVSVAVVESGNNCGQPGVSAYRGAGTAEHDPG